MERIEVACTREKSMAIHDFATGRLGIKEGEALLDHLTSCADCSAEFDEIADLVGALDRAEASGADAGTERNDARTTYDSRNDSRMIRRIPWRPIRVVAAGIVICLAAWWIAPEFGGPASRLSRLSVIDPIPAVFIRLRSEEAESLPPAYASAMEAYARRGYAQAIRLFNDVLEQKPDHLPSILYLGICHLQAGDPREAVTALQRAASQGSGLLRERSIWYLGNAFLKLGEKKEALRQFEKLEGMEGDFELNARDMIRKIEEIPEP